MATHQAIAATSAAIKQLIDDRWPRDIFDNLETKVLALSQLDGDSVPDSGFVICLWRVTINTQRRARGPRTDKFGRRFKPSLPIDLSFLIIPVAEKADMQQRLLGWLMRMMEDAGPITAGQLNHFLAESDIFAPDEEVELVCDPLPISDYLTLWDRVKTMPQGMNYLTRLVLIDSDQMIDEAGPVITRAFEFGGTPS
jgi:hypothetical protein